MVPGERKANTPCMGTCVSLFPEDPKKGKEQTHILEFKCLFLHLALERACCLAIAPLLSQEGYLYPSFILSIIKKTEHYFFFFFLSSSFPCSLSSFHFPSGFRGVEREKAPLVGQRLLSQVEESDPRERALMGPRSDPTRMGARGRHSRARPCRLPQALWAGLLRRFLRVCDLSVAGKYRCPPHCVCLRFACRRKPTFVRLQV